MKYKLIAYRTSEQLINLINEDDEKLIALLGKKSITSYDLNVMNNFSPPDLWRQIKFITEDATKNKEEVVLLTSFNSYIFNIFGHGIMAGFFKPEDIEIIYLLEDGEEKIAGYDEEGFIVNGVYGFFEDWLPEEFNK